MRPRTDVYVAFLIAVAISFVIAILFVDPILIDGMCYWLLLVVDFGDKRIKMRSRVAK